MKNLQCKDNTVSPVCQVLNSQNQKKVKLPSGHRFFGDCMRETHARWIEWNMTRKNEDAWFATLTFKTFTSEIQAEKLKKCWLGRMSRALNRKTKGSGKLRWISATEWQIRDVIHYHIIVISQGLGALSRKRWEHRWQTMSVDGRNGPGFCRIYDASKKSAPYLAKYQNKSRGGQIQWGGSWWGLNAPASVQCCKPGNRDVNGLPITAVQCRR